MHKSWLLLLLGAVLAACGYGAEPEPYPLPAASEDVADGAVLYARLCAWCHGSQGEGTSRGPDLDGELDGGAYTHFMLSTGRMPLDSPTERSSRGPTVLDTDQIDALVAHVEGFGGSGPPVPDPDPEEGNVSRGAELYLTNCAPCHSSTGVGGALTSGEAAPALKNPDITPTQVAEAMLVGPGCENTDPECGAGSGAMPRFGFDADEVDDIVAYVSRLQTGGNQGGWSIGRIGPVTEGAIGWLLGLGSMLVVIRWIGTRVGEKR
jgi:ubiquinol-cytochrome c reductase cytochrome c subunit